MDHHSIQDFNNSRDSLDESIMMTSSSSPAYDDVTTIHDDDIMDHDGRSISIHRGEGESDVSEDREGFQQLTTKNMLIMATRIDDLMVALRDLQDRLDKIQESKSKPTGCGFSCSNNSFTL